MSRECPFKTPQKDIEGVGPYRGMHKKPEDREQTERHKNLPTAARGVRQFHSTQLLCFRPILGLGFSGEKDIRETLGSSRSELEVDEGTIAGVYEEEGKARRASV